MTREKPVLKLILDQADDDRLDKVIAKHCANLGRRRILRLFEDKLVRLNDRVARKGNRGQPGDILTVHGLLGTPRDMIPIPRPGPLAVVHQDPFIVAVDKPAGVPTHPLQPREEDTVANWLLARFPECATAGDDPREAGFTHRLDRETSGVIVAARSSEIWMAMRALFHTHQVEKHYWALVEGSVAPGSCTASISHAGAHVRASTEGEGLAAHTQWTVERTLAHHTLLSCKTVTGRMHQVRAHLAHAGHPIAGDHLYGSDSNVPFFLHAYRIEFPHPSTGIPCVIEAPQPESLARILTGQLGVA